LRYVLPLVVIAALVLAVPLLAQQAAPDVDRKLQEIDKKLAELGKLKADLEALRDSMKPAGEKKPSWADKVKINGYFHTRAQWRDFDEDDFDLRRMYINLIVTPNDKTMAVVTWARIGPDWAGTTNADWANVFVDYKWSKEWTTRFGQGPDWFGLETAQGSGDRLALERASVLEGGRGKPLGMYFQGPWDRGVWVTHNPTHGKWEPQATLGVINGQFRGPERDDNRTLTLDLKWKQEWGQFGLSWLDGKYVWDVPAFVNPNAPAPAPLPFYMTSFDRKALLGYARWDPAGSHWAVQGEYLDGEHLGADIEGWYTQLEYDPSEEGTAYVKFEKHDAAVGAPSALGSPTYHAWIAGYAHNLDANNELTLQYTDGENAGASRNEVGFQWQLKF
jgi:hypothetical protein